MTKKAQNQGLNEAKISKKDEFYTNFPDIVRELNNYKLHFKDKVVFCNCDDPYESNFFKYFALNFNHLGLKRLICTCYVGSPITGDQLSLFDVEPIKEVVTESKKPHKIIINEVKDLNEDGAIDLVDIKTLLKSEKNVLTLLDGSGDFRSVECIELLKESDIVVTNPPFSLFREYVAQLVEYKKDFLIIGNLNAITYKEIFYLIEKNKIWLGVTMDGRNKWFQVPNSYPIRDNVANSRIEDGKKYLFVKGCLWFTNLNNSKRDEDLILYKKYNEEEYQQYDNYNAINVNRVTEIPMDFKGVMGVPITFLNKYNPNQFEVIGSDYNIKDGLIPNLIKPNWTGKLDRGYINGKRIYSRIFIKNKKI